MSRFCTSDLYIPSQSLMYNFLPNFSITNRGFYMRTISLLALALIFSAANAKPGYFRSADLHDNTLVFTAEGDLWLSDINSKQANRLTTHSAEEKESAFSPDGEFIAFSANYEGATEVYVIPKNGGVAKRVSYENSRVKVQGWTPDGQVLYSSNSRMGIPGSWLLVSVDPDTLKTVEIPLADAIEGAVDDQGKFIYFVRFGLQVSTDNVRSYRGGAQGKLWRYELGSDDEATPLAASHEGSIREPMINGDNLYFISDASGTDNIWSMNLTNNELDQITDFEGYEVRSAKLSGNQIVFQHAADIKTIELSSGSIQTHEINLISDFPNLRSHWENKPLKFMNDANLSPKGDKAVITARGMVAVAGVDELRLVEVDTGKDNRSRAAVLSKDGQWIYAISDRSGENEIWRFAANGSDDAKQLTKDGSVYRWNLYLSPDGEKIAHDDNEGRLYVLNLKTGKNKEILSDNWGLAAFGHVTWSSDSGYLAITRNHLDDLRSRIMLYGVDSGKSLLLTSDKYESYSPAFSHDGNWLYFLSDRNFVASPGHPWGDRNTGSNFDRRTEVYAYALNDDAEFPFQAPSELAQDKKSKKDDGKAKKDKDKDKDEDASKMIQVHWDGLKSRLWKVPVESGNYGQLSVNDKFLFLSDRVNEPNQKPMIKSLKLEHKAKPKKFTDNITGFELSQDGKKLFLGKDKGGEPQLFIVPAGETFPKDPKGTQVMTQSWQLLIDPQLEWQQMFRDTWLMHRDQFFDKNMRGVDWKQIKAKYQPLLDRLTDRYELNDVFAQMVGELNALHSQVRGGDVPNDPDSPKAATLGALLEQVKEGVMISQIYQHDFELPHLGSPLAKPGVKAANGDVIIAVNGQSTPTLSALNQQLRNQVGKQVLLELSRGDSSHKIIVVPVSTRDDYRLRYQHWVDSRKTMVKSVDDGIGYFHLQAMGANDFANFTREFYHHYDKSALIIDVRRNRGGNVDSLMLEKLLRQNWVFWQTRRGTQWENMQQTFTGHLVVLADQFTYSDGETFTAGIKAMDIGTVVGKQTAGAGVWLSGRNRVVDRGISRVAEYPVYDLDGNWVVEGHGVKPDVEVDNLPHSTFNGSDAQLQAAIELLQQKLKDQPIKPKSAEDFPAVNIPAKDVN